MMKKVLSMALAIILTFSVVTVAFAEPDGCDGQPTVTSNPDYPQFMINSDSELVEVK